MISIADLERSEELENSMLDLTLAVTRLLGSSERRHSLDDVLERFGFSRESLLEERTD